MKVEEISLSSCIKYFSQISELTERVLESGITIYDSLVSVCLCLVVRRLSVIL